MIVPTHRDCRDGPAQAAGQILVRQPAQQGVLRSRPETLFAVESWNAQGSVDKPTELIAYLSL